MSNALFHRLLHRKAAAPTTLRMNVCPAGHRPSAAPVVDAMRWLVGQQHRRRAVRCARPLERARSEFLGLDGRLVDMDTTDLLRRAARPLAARAVALRSELYTLNRPPTISQQEADKALATRQPDISRPGRNVPASFPRRSPMSSKPRFDPLGLAELDSRSRGRRGRHATGMPADRAARIALAGPSSR